ncbi:hypothetical protein [Aquitalea magnusonii]|jgi:hypothetical protein|uniref:hypothetical protein n=1 Tax=Aquitalea magnusonii TaxID=332411 RepID=UPI0011AE2268|nr:hypothetical protein [Aquitalea magnusonii]
MAFPDGCPMVIGRPFLHFSDAGMHAVFVKHGLFFVSSQLLGGDVFGSEPLGSSVKVTAKGDGDGTGSEGLAG